MFAKPYTFYRKRKPDFSSNLMLIKVRVPKNSTDEKFVAEVWEFCGRMDKLPARGALVSGPEGRRFQVGSYETCPPTNWVDLELCHYRIPDVQKCKLVALGEDDSCEEKGIPYVVLEECFPACPQKVRAGVENFGDRNTQYSYCDYRVYFDPVYCVNWSSNLGIICCDKMYQLDSIEDLSDLKKIPYFRARERNVSEYYQQSDGNSS